MTDDTLVSVPGFRAAGVRCGIKQKGLDLALLVSDVPAQVAAVFTRSTVPGAPVVVSREHAKLGRARAIVANSGCSNVAMGAKGVRDAKKMADLAAKAVGCTAKEVLVASTGVIGEPLPLEKIESGVADARRALAFDGLPKAAEAILTTDLVPKVAQAHVMLGGRMITIAGICKGSGMIEPNMATMLAFVLTDAAIAPAYLKRLWQDVVDRSFNRVTVDGEMSTSDTAILLANGSAGNPPLQPGAGSAPFAKALSEVCETLAKALARDGEGASKLVTVRVAGARTPADAERAARRVANSLLVKTALFGGDANWGRILQTIGAAQIPIDLAKTEVRLCGVPVFKRGASAGPAARQRAQTALQGAKEVELVVLLGAGKAEASIWTCDLSYDYVRINAEYRT